MIICIDIGNTNIKYGIFEGDELRVSFRATTDSKRTSDEYGAQLVTMMKVRNISPDDITGGILSSVVPSLDYTILHMCRVYLNISLLQLAPGLKSGLPLRCDNAKEVGADRIVNCVSAITKYGKKGRAILIVDFGTATTINIISPEEEFIGGVIAPGIKGSLDSLVNGTAKLPRIEIEAPKSVIAKNTVTNMQAGIVYGFAGMVEFLIKKIKKELKCEDVITIATGGFSEIISKETSCIDKVDRLLTLEGLKYLYYLNTSEDK